MSVREKRQKFNKFPFDNFFNSQNSQNIKRATTCVDRTAKDSDLSPSTTESGKTKSEEKVQQTPAILAQLEASQFQMRELLEYVLDLHGFNSSNSDVVYEIENRGTTIGSRLSPSGRTEKLLKVINICQKQIIHIENVEKPVEFLQSAIRTYNVCENMALLNKINTDIWKNLLKTEKEYLAQLESISKNYQFPIAGKIEFVAPQIVSIFDYVENVYSVTKTLLTKLEGQNFYYPLIFALGKIFNGFSQDFLKSYSFYFDDLTRKLDLLEDLRESVPDLSDFLNKAQAASPFPDLSLEELLKLPSEHFRKYEDILGELVHDMTRATNLVAVTEITFKSASHKPHKSWSFIEEFKLRKQLKEVKTTGIGDMMKGVMGNKDKPKKKKAEDEENEEVSNTENVDKLRRSIKNVPLLRSASSIEEFTGRKRVGSSIRPSVSENKKPVEKRPLPPKIDRDRERQEREKERQEKMERLERLEREKVEKDKAEKVSATMPTKQAQEFLKQINSQLESNLTSGQIFEPREEELNDVTSHINKYREKREKAYGSSAYRKKPRETILPSSSRKSESKENTQPGDMLPKMKPDKVEISSLAPCIQEELKSLWMSYNEIKQQSMRLDQLSSAALFYHLYRHQLSQFLISKSCYLICEGNLTISKKKQNERDTPQTEKRYYFLFRDFLIIGNGNADRKRLENIYELNDVWPLKDLKILTAPEPVDDDDKITFEISIQKVKPSRDGTNETASFIHIPINIISDDQFFKILRDQIDQSGTKIFGVDLMKIHKRPDLKDEIPDVVHITTQWIRERCMDVEGIFRKSGAYARVEDLKNRFDQGLVTQISAEEDEHVVANVLKLFFREMPVPLVPYSHYNRFMEIGVKFTESDDTETLVDTLQPLLLSFPRPHLVLLFFLLKFLNQISKFSEATKMDSSNLAIVFACNIIKAEQETIESTVKFNHVNNLFKLMIENVSKLEEKIPSLKKDSNRTADFVQDLIRYTKQTPVYVEENNAGPIKPEDIPSKDVPRDVLRQTKNDNRASQTTTAIRNSKLLSASANELRDEISSIVSPRYSNSWGKKQL